MNEKFGQRGAGRERRALAAYVAGIQGWGDSPQVHEPPNDRPPSPPTENDAYELLLRVLPSSNRANVSSRTSARSASQRASHSGSVLM